MSWRSDSSSVPDVAEASGNNRTEIPAGSEDKRSSDILKCNFYFCGQTISSFPVRHLRRVKRLIWAGRGGSACTVKTSAVRYSSSLYSYLDELGLRCHFILTAGFLLRRI